jgi:hypothetical protein
VPWYFLIVEVSIKPYILGSKQRINCALYLSKPYVAFKDLFTPWFCLGRYIVGKRALVFFPLLFPLFLKRLLYLSPSALSILCFR